MSRIRTIKPEFPQAESMGRISREARLLFIQLLTLVDDAGRARGASRLLASLLYPYDDDAPGLIGAWLDELEAEGCIVRYVVDGETYLSVTKWAEHQRIDKPTESKLPPPPASSRAVANPRETSRDLAPRARAPDRGPSTMDQGKDLTEQPTPQSASADRWQGLEEAIRVSYGGKATRNKRTGERLAWAANIIRVAGAKAGDDPGAAVALWCEWWASLEPRFRPQPIAAADKLATWEHRSPTDPVVRF